MPLCEGESILGKYRILKLIGQGAMARVWLAEEPEFGERQVAIKEPRTDLLPEDLQDVQRRFRQEVEMAKLLDESHVPHVIRSLTLELMPDGARLLVMEYAAGGSLAERIAKHPGGMPIEQAVQTTIDICKALQAFHELAVMPVHRDIKPSNVLFDAQGQAHLADFGLCQLPGRSSRSRLQGGPHPGTPLYMAPEQANSPEPLMPAADVFALGCVLFEMVTRKAYKRVKPGTEPSVLRSEVPAWLDAVVRRALVEDPWERYDSVEEMAEDLRGKRAPKWMPQRPWEGGEESLQDIEAAAKGLVSERTFTEQLARIVLRLGRSRLLTLSLLLLMLLGCGAFVFFPNSAVRTAISPIATAIAEAARQRATAQAVQLTAQAAQAATAQAVQATQAAQTASAVVEAEHRRATTVESSSMHSLTPSTPTSESEEKLSHLPIVDRLRVPADGTAVDSDVELEFGTMYTIITYGTFSYTSDGKQADAVGPLEAGKGTPYLMIDGAYAQPNLFADRSSKKYAWMYTGAGTKVTFKVYDPFFGCAWVGKCDGPYEDNSGSIAIEIRQGIP